MKPSIHVATSFSVALVLYFFTKSIYATLLCLVSGILVDFDHVIEYLVHFGGKDINIERIYQACRELLFKKLYLVFHSIEIVIIFWIMTALTRNIYVLAIALGYSSHIILDFVGNPLHPFSYFVTRRFMRKFETHKLLRHGKN